MPPPIKVELMPHDPRWAEMAEAEATLLFAALGGLLLEVHHIGSTSIPGIRAKPVLDLIPVVGSHSELDQQQAELLRIGYEYWGEFGLKGRRYCSKDDPQTGRRLVQLHCYVVGSPEISRHLAFLDYLRANPSLAQAYDLEKARRPSQHPEDSHAYGDCKDAWIRRIEAEALQYMKV